MYTLKELAKLLKVSDSFLYARVAEGSLPHYRLGNGQGGIRVSEEQLQEYLRGRERSRPREEEPPLRHLR
jgi:excisionase family DNA binding protein